MFFIYTLREVVYFRIFSHVNTSCTSFGFCSTTLLVYSIRRKFSGLRITITNILVHRCLENLVKKAAFIIFVWRVFSLIFSLSFISKCRRIRVNSSQIYLRIVDRFLTGYFSYLGLVYLNTYNVKLLVCVWEKEREGDERVDERMASMILRIWLTCNAVKALSPLSNTYDKIQQ